jgi:hypothetical protein
MVGLIAFSIWFTETVEKRFSGRLKSLLLKTPRKPAPEGVRPVVSEERAA